MNDDFEYSKLTIKCKSTGEYAVIQQTMTGNFSSEVFDKADRKVTTLTDSSLETIVIRTRIWIQDQNYLMLSIQKEVKHGTETNAHTVQNIEGTNGEGMSEPEMKPWYASRYGERALPGRGGDHLANWELDMSPEAVERRERVGAQMRKEFDDDQKEILDRFREMKKEKNAHG